MGRSKQNKSKKRVKEKKVVKTTTGYKKNYLVWSSILGKYVTKKERDEALGKTGSFNTYNGKGYTYTPKEVIVPDLNISDEDKEDYVKRMIGIFEVQSTTYNQELIIGYVSDIVKDIPDCKLYEDGMGNLYVEKGKAETFPCVVAHLDTVHRIIPKDNFAVIRDKDVLFAVDRSDYGRTGIGGDDNVGIFIALEILRKYDNVKVAFFVDEEAGCIGSNGCDLDFFRDCSMIFQADRQKYEDLVDSISGITMFGSQFRDAISGILAIYNRETTSGGMTDVMTLAENGIDVCMFNASCGYYRPHSDYEYVKINEVILTLFMFQDIINLLHVDGEKWGFKRVGRQYGIGFQGAWNDYLAGGGVKQLKPAEEETEYDTVKEVNGNKAHIDIDCSFCDQPTDYDVDLDLNYCHNCQMYDYNK